MAIILTDRPGGYLLYAPAVTRRISGSLDLSAESRAQAVAWLNRICG